MLRRNQQNNRTHYRPGARTGLKVEESVIVRVKYVFTKYVTLVAVEFIELKIRTSLLSSTDASITIITNMQTLEL